MANWTVKATAAALDTVNNNGNILVTFVATNSATSETVTQIAPSSNWTTIKAQAYAQGMIDQLNARDAIKATAATVLPAINAYVAQNNILASG